MSSTKRMRVWCQFRARPQGHKGCQHMLQAVATHLSSSASVPLRTVLLNLLTSNRGEMERWEINRVGVAGKAPSSLPAHTGRRGACFTHRAERQLLARGCSKLQGWVWRSAQLPAEPRPSPNACLPGAAMPGRHRGEGRPDRPRSCCPQHCQAAPAATRCRAGWFPCCAGNSELQQRKQQQFVNWQLSVGSRHMAGDLSQADYSSSRGAQQRQALEDGAALSCVWKVTSAPKTTVHFVALCFLHEC